MKTIRWGILGTGFYRTCKFASDLRLVKDAELIAIGSRSQQSANEFNKEFPVKYIHNTLSEALVQNPEIDVNIHCHTPYNMHYETFCLLAAW